MLALVASLAGCDDEGGGGSADAGNVDDGGGLLDAGDGADGGGLDAGTDGGSNGPDTTPPTVTATSPSDDAEDVPISTTITVTFDEAMDASTIPGAIEVGSDKEDPYGVVTYDAATRTATFTPHSPLIPYTAYTVYVGTSARDASGNALAAPITVHFLTLGTGAAPHVLGVFPFDGDTNAYVGQSPYVELDRAMDPASLTNAFTLRRTSDGALVPGTVLYSEGEVVTVRFDPTDRLSCPTSYTAELTTDARSAGGVRIASTVTFTFTTGCPRFGILMDNHPEEYWWSVYGRVTDDQGKLDCGLNGYYCYGTYVVGTQVTLTATPSVSGVFYRWSGPAAFCTGTNPTITVSLGEDASAECRALFGPSDSLNATLTVTYGPWIDRVYDATSGSPRIDCGPAPNPSVCSASVKATDAASLELSAIKNPSAPAGTITWTCTQANLVDPPTQSQFVRTGTSIGPLYLNRDTSCLVELVPNPP